MNGFAVKLHDALSGVTRLSGIRDLLKVYVDHFGLFGAALWEQAIFEDAPLTEGELFIQAQYFETREHPPFYSLGPESISARCIRDGQPARHSRVNGIWDGQVNYPQVLSDLRIDAFISAPTSLRLDSKTKPDAALTFYLSGRAFSDTEYADLLEAAKLFSAAYQSVRDRVCLSLLTRVHDISGHSQTGDAQDAASVKPSQVLDNVLRAIADTFQFVESVVYLHDPDADPAGRYRLASSIWPWDAPLLPCYEAGDGGTGWVLQQKKPLHILDMSTYKEHRDYYERAYPQLRWPDRYDVTKLAQNYFSVSREELFPLSYACVPIIHGGFVTGALRCCISRNGPYHIDHDIMEMLVRVARVLADWWDHSIQERRRDKDRRMVTALGAANKYVVQQMPDSFDVDKAIRYLLAVCKKSVPQAEIAQVWLKEDDRRLRSATNPERKLSIEDAKGSYRNAFGYVVRMGSALHLENPAKSMFIAPSEPEARSMTLAPIVTTGTIGILLLATRQAASWPEFISSSAIFFAAQLALYLSFRDQLLKAKESERRMIKALDEQGQLFLDFQHQLKSPIKIARNSAERMRNCNADSPEWRHAYGALVSSTVRAGTVANNLDFFVSISQGRPVSAKNTWNPVAQVLQSAEQASGFLYNKSALGRAVEFSVIKEYRYPLPYFLADQNLVDLAVDNLLDNAVKYSYPHTCIVIEAGTALFGDEVYFSFRNKGLTISAQDVPKLSIRGHRGEKAKISSPEGTGIGLWAVNEIMKSMGGRLQICPTDSEGWNDIRLVFKGSGHDQINLSN